jgi:hypothetical protein
MEFLARATVLNKTRSALCGSTRIGHLLLFVDVKTIIREVGISDLKINTFLWTGLHVTFYPSPSIIK